MTTESRSKEEEGNLKDHWKTLNEVMQMPFLEPIEFALTVSTSFDRRSACMPQVTIKPLFPEHRDECGEQGHGKTCVHEHSNSDDLAGNTLGRWNDGSFARDSGLVEGEEDGTEEGC